MRQSAAVLGTRRAVFSLTSPSSGSPLDVLASIRRGFRNAPRRFFVNVAVVRVAVRRSCANPTRLEKETRRRRFFFVAAPGRSNSRFFLFARRFCRTRAFYGSLGREFAATFSGIALFLGGTRRQRKRVAKPNVDKKRRRTPGRKGDDGQAILLGKSSLNFLKFA